MLATYDLPTVPTLPTYLTIFSLAFSISASRSASLKLGMYDSEYHTYIHIHT